MMLQFYDSKRVISEEDELEDVDKFDAMELKDPYKDEIGSK